MTAVLQRFLNVRRDEVAPLLISAFYFFCVLSALMVLRPARDALGMTRGMDDIRWLFVGTAFVTLAVNPIFGYLVSRFRRITFISATYGFFTLSLVGFYLLLTMTPEAVGDASGKVFYVWFSVFNLFCTMLFWAFMADRFTLEQSKRLFGAIAVGGTLGAINGPWLANELVETIGTPSLLLIAAGFLLLAIISTWVLSRYQPEQHVENASNSQSTLDRSVIGGNAWQGITAVLQSKYLIGISFYMLILSVIATFIYFTRLQMVGELVQDTDQRTRMFAKIDYYTQIATFALQLVITGHIMRWLGVSVALVLLPLTVALGFVGLAATSTITVLIALDVAFKAVQRAVMRPARETLFTIVSREDKYKSKAVTDTFVYRGGDVIGAWTEGGVKQFGAWAGGHAGAGAEAARQLAAGLVALASVVVPLSVVWAILGFWLGQQQQKIAAEQDAANPDNLTETVEA